MDKYIGFDIDDKKTVACVVQKGKKDKYATFATGIEQMRKFLTTERQGREKLHLTFEISGQAGYRYDQLGGFVDDITVSNPSKMTWIYRTAKKNDRIDARKQAILLSIGEVPKVHIPSQEIRQWRVAILHRRNTVGKITAVKNRIRALLKANGFVKAPHRGSWWKVANRKWMRSLTVDINIVFKDLWRMNLLDMLEELWILEDQLTRMTAYLDGYLAKHPAAKLLLSIPGIGPRTTEAVLAYTDDIRRFDRSKQYCAYFGLTPRLDESGLSRRLGHISKQGPSVVRWLLVEAAWRVVKKSPAFGAFYERVMCGQDGRKKIAIVAVARKLLSVMRAMQLGGELFNEKLVCNECGVSEIVKVKNSA